MTWYINDDYSEIFIICLSFSLTKKYIVFKMFLETFVICH